MISQGLRADPGAGLTVSVSSRKTALLKPRFAGRKGVKGFTPLPATQPASGLRQRLTRQSQLPCRAAVQRSVYQVRLSVGSGLYPQRCRLAIAVCALKHEAKTGIDQLLYSACDMHAEYAFCASWKACQNSVNILLLSWTAVPVLENIS